MNSTDWAVIFIYMLVVFAVGILSSKRVSRVFDYFLAERSFGVFPIAVSILATETSAATLIGGPDTAYRGNLAYLQTTIGAVLSRFFLAYFFIDVYYRHRVYTVYQFLAFRFGVRTQIITASLYSVARMLASAARLYIAGFAVSTIADVNIHWAIVLVSLVGILYSISGGLRAVVWTDMIQAFIFLSVGLYAVYYVINSVGGIEVAHQQLAAAGKLKFLESSWDLLSPSFWANPYTFLGAVIGGFTLGVATHGTDQDNVQRMLACRTSKQGRWSLVVAGLLEIPTAVIYIGLGLVLWVYYQTPNVLAPGANDSVYPHFIRHVVPHGLKGLFVAAIFAASMSSLDSVLNALASVSITDIYLPLRFGRKERLTQFLGNEAASYSVGDEVHLLRLSRICSTFWGLVLMGFAMLIAIFHQRLLAVAPTADENTSRSLELLTLALGIMSLVYGPLLAVFLVGLFTKRGTQLSLAIGVIAGVAVTLVLQFVFEGSVGWTWQTVIGCIVTTAIASAIKPIESTIN